MTPTATPTPSPEPPQPLKPSPQTGPRTAAGKARCRLNAYRHGLTGQVLILTPEEQQAFDALAAELNAHYSPLGPVETQLVYAIADSRWRLDRVSAIENSIYAQAAFQPIPHSAGHPEVDAAFAQANTWLAEAKNLALLTLYEQRIHRKLAKDTQALAAEQARRIAEYEQAMSVAKRLYKAAAAEGKPYNPEAYFRRPPQTSDSVFSPAAVTREIARDAVSETLALPKIAELPPRKQAA